jgi:acetyl-CoA acyltransferase
VPGYAIDRMCAGALTAIVNAANAIRVGAQDLVLAGGVEHMGHHPMGAEVDPNPRFLSDKLVDPSALVMGNTAENLHDAFPTSPANAATSSRCSPRSAPQGTGRRGLRRPRRADDRPHRRGVAVVDVDEHPRPGTTMESLASSSPLPPGRYVTAGNAAGLNDGAGGVLLASEAGGRRVRSHPEDAARRLRLRRGRPETMGYGPVPATEKLLERNRPGIDDIDVIDMNEAFAVQCVAFLDHFGLPLDSEKVNPYGGAIAMGHPLAFSGAGSRCSSRPTSTVTPTPSAGSPRCASGSAWAPPSSGNAPDHARDRAPRTTKDPPCPD